MGKWKWEIWEMRNAGNGKGKWGTWEIGNMRKENVKNETCQKWEEMGNVRNGNCEKWEIWELSLRNRTKKEKCGKWKMCDIENVRNEKHDKW